MLEQDGHFPPNKLVIGIDSAVEYIQATRKGRFIDVSKLGEVIGSSTISGEGLEVYRYYRDHIREFSDESVVHLDLQYQDLRRLTEGYLHFQGDNLPQPIKVNRISQLRQLLEEPRWRLKIQSR